MASQSRRNSKGYSGAGSENGRKGSKEATPDFNVSSASISAPKYGTVVPERVFVGGISMSMTEPELTEFFSKYGKVVDTKIIVDRAGVSKGYGFITFDSEEEAKKLLSDADNIMLRERKLNIAPAIKKQSFNQRLEVNNGTANVVGTPLFGTSLPFTYHNGVTYYCQYPNSAAISAPQQAAHQPPPQPAPPNPTAHLDANLYPSYAGIAAPAPPYHQVVYNPAIYYQPQYQYPVTTCEAIEGNMTDTSLQGGTMAGGSTAVGGQVMIAPNGYYLQEIPPYQEYAYAHSYVTYQPAPDPQPQPHHAVIQFSPAAAPPPPPSRPVYDSPILLPEQNVGRSEVRNVAAPPQQPQVQIHHLQQPAHHHHHQSSQHLPPQSQHHPIQSQQVVKTKETPSTPLCRPTNPKQSSNHQHRLDTNNNNPLIPQRPPYPRLHPNPNPLGSQVFPAPQNMYPRPPTASSSTPPFPQYSNNNFSNNSAGTLIRKFRRPYNQGMKVGRGGGGRGGGSVSSYSSGGGGGGGLVTPPSTPRSGQPSPDHPSSQVSSQQDHLVHSMKSLKAA